MSMCKCWQFQVTSNRVIEECCPTQVRYALHIIFLLFLLISVIHLFCRTCFSRLRYSYPFSHPSVSMFVRPYARPFTIYVDPSIYVHSNDLFSETNAPMVLKFHMWHGLRMRKLSLVENPRCLQNGWVYLAEILPGSLVGL